jgi:hypothetical protein
LLDLNIKISQRISRTSGTSFEFDYVCKFKLIFDMNLGDESANISFMCLTVAHPLHESIILVVLFKVRVSQEFRLRLFHRTTAIGPNRQAWKQFRISSNNRGVISIHKQPSGVFITEELIRISDVRYLFQI